MQQAASLGRCRRRKMEEAAASVQGVGVGGGDGVCWVGTGGQEEDTLC